MTAKRKFKSDAFAAIHSSANPLLEVGAIDKTTMRDFDESCLTKLPEIDSEANDRNRCTTTAQNESVDFA
jgi:putative transcriptional regulator